MEWGIRFQRKGETEESVVILPSLLKLLWWLVCNAAQCEGLVIIGARRDESDV